MASKPKPAETSAEALYSPTTLSYLQRLVNVAVAWAQSLNKGHVPSVRLLPLTPMAGKTRGSATDADSAAQTYAVIPQTVQVNARSEKRKSGKRTLTVPVVDRKAGEATVVKVSDAWTILVSVLRFDSQLGKAADAPRSTADLLHDAAKALLHVIAGYAPGAAGKLSDFKALCESVGVTPSKVRKVKDGEPATDKDGKPAWRLDYSKLTLSAGIRETLAQRIMDAELPLDPPADLTLDYLRFLRGAREQGAAVRKASIIVNGTAYTIRMTLKELRTLLEASGATAETLVDTIPNVTIRVDADFAREALTKRTREQYRADVANPDKPTKARKRAKGVVPPRIAPAVPATT